MLKSWPQVFWALTSGVKQAGLNHQPKLGDSKFYNNYLYKTLTQVIN